MKDINKKKTEEKTKCTTCPNDSLCSCETSSGEEKSLEVRLKKCEAEKQEYLDGWQRARADFVNARRDEEKLRVDLVKYAKADLIIELLGVVDNFERAFSNKDTWEKVDKNWRIGVEYIYSQLMDILKNNGVSEIGKVGDKFDATMHQSVDSMQTENEADDDKISEITSKGFMLNGKIIRPAKVIIWHLTK